jgi:heme oxygenase
MSISAKLDQLRQVVDAYRTISLTPLVESNISFQEWDGLSFDEFVSTFEKVRGVLKSALEKDIFRRMPFAHVNGIHSTLQNLIPLVQQFISSRDFGTFQNAANHVDSLHHVLHAYGVVAQVEGVADATRVRELFEGELGRLTKSNSDAEILTKNVRALIEPAVSGSLSKSFSDRVRNLFWTRVFWAVAAVALGIWGLVEATLLVSDLKTIMSSGSFWVSLATRSIVLLPIYIGFGFVVSQYKKERDFEEEYAHKAALSTSLPNYRDLAKEDAVKDQIASKAAEVIFSPPTDRTKSDVNKATPLIASVKELVDSVGKAARGN